MASRPIHRGNSHHSPPAVDRQERRAKPVAATSPRKVKSKSRVDDFNELSASGVSLAESTSSQETLSRSNSRGWTSDEVSSAGKKAAKAVARNLRVLSHMLAQTLREAPPTVREIRADPQALRFPEQRFSNGSEAFLQSLATLTAQSDGATAASFTAALAGNVAKSAALTASAPVTRLAEYGLKLARATLQATHEGLPTADLILLSGRLSVATAQVVSHSEEERVLQSASEQLSDFRHQLGELLASQPHLKPALTPLLA